MWLTNINASISIDLHVINQKRGRLFLAG